MVLNIIYDVIRDVINYYARSCYKGSILNIFK